VSTCSRRAGRRGSSVARVAGARPARCIAAGLSGSARPRAADLGDGRDRAARDAHAAAHMVLGGLPRRRASSGDLGHGASAPARAVALRAGVADLAQLRRLMVAPEREPLEDQVEVDEFFLGGLEGGPQGRPPARQQVVEVRGAGSGRLRLQVLQDASSASLGAFAQATTARARSCTPTAGRHNGLGTLGYEHRPRGPIRQSKGPRPLPQPQAEAR
jgi:hypothetical protein